MIKKGGFGVKMVKIVQNGQKRVKNVIFRRFSRISMSYKMHTIFDHYFDDIFDAKIGSFFRRFLGPKTTPFGGGPFSRQNLGFLTGPKKGCF